MTLSSSERHPLPRQGGGLVQQLSPVGIHGIRDNVRLQPVPLHGREAVPAPGAAVHRGVRLRRNRIPGVQVQVRGQGPEEKAEIRARCGQRKVRGGGGVGEM